MLRIALRKNSKTALILLHFLIFSIGLMKFTGVITQHIYATFNFHYTLSLVYSWMSPDGSDPIKLPVLLHYLLFLSALFIFYAVCFWVLRSGNQCQIVDSFFGFDTRLNPIEPRALTEDAVLRSKFYKHDRFYDLFFNKKRNIILYLTGILAFNFYCFISNRHTWVLGLIWLFFAFYLPVQYLKLTRIITLRWLGNRFLFSNVTYCLLTVTITSLFLVIFYPLCLTKSLVANEYMDIPEKTILANHVVVDNADFIKMHRLGGFVKYDPRVDHGATPKFPENKCVKLTYTPMLDYFISISGREYRYAYNKSTGVLSLKGVMTKRERVELLSFYKSDLVNQALINQLFAASIKEATFFKHQFYSDDEKDFIHKNMIEMHNQTRAGWFFFHHSWMLNPILASTLGVDLFKQPLIYGLGSTYAVKAIMQFIGGIDYQTYFKVLFSFYPIYFVLFVTMIFMIFKRLDYVLMAAMLLSCAIYALGDDAIRLAPGYNPVRHLFDIPVFLLYFYYLRQSKVVLLLGTMVVCIGAVLWSKDFGICLLIAISVTEMIRLILNRPWIRRFFRNQSHLFRSTKKFPISILFRNMIHF